MLGSNNRREAFLMEKDPKTVPVSMLARTPARIIENSRDSDAPLTITHRWRATAMSKQQREASRTQSAPIVISMRTAGTTFMSEPRHG
jgi:hypothetical protein